MRFSYLVFCLGTLLLLSACNISNMRLTSSAFENMGTIPFQYTCDGPDVNPPLNISDVPEGVQSLVMIMDDPDAIKPAGRIWDHWIVWNIPADTSEIAEGVEPEGIHGIGTGGNLDYHGPCPPDAEHKYHFKLYALDVMLDLEKGVGKAEVEMAMKGHILEETVLFGLYERQ